MASPMPPMRDIPTLLRRFTEMGGEAARAAQDAFIADFRAILALPPDQVPEGTQEAAAWAAAVRNAHAYYAWSWDARAVSLVPDLVRAIETRAGAHRPDIEGLLELLDLLFFLGWCFEASNVAQCRLVLPGMRAAAGGFARTARAGRPPRQGRPLVCFLSMFAGARDVMTLGPRLVMRALRSLPRGGDGGCDIAMVAWRFADPGFLDQMRAQGVQVTATGGETPAERLAQAEAALAAIAPDIIISDMNNAVPIAIFARRAAPVQVFLQGGLPAFPQPGLDGVFDSFGIGAAETGWGDARLLPFRPNWDLEMLVPAPDASQIAAERARMLPGEGKLIGSYGRLVKVTPEYLRAVEQILLAVPGARFVTGGSGDPGPILAFAKRSPVGHRMDVQGRWVPGHSWGRMLDLMLDTWPQTGGESVRETMAKGCPVLAIRSAEMPAMDLQRDPALLAEDWDGYQALAIDLLRNEDARAEAGRRAAAFAQHMADPAPFAGDIAASIAALLDDARARPLPPAAPPILDPPPHPPEPPRGLLGRLFGMGR